MGALIESGFGKYQGILEEIPQNFKLFSDNIPIFEQEFNSEDTEVVTLGITSSTISFAQHYFVTGEELTYNVGSGSTNEPIGIATTVISGISTDILPQSVFVIKVDERKIKLAATAQDALQSQPKFLEFTSLGIGTEQYFTAKNQLSKSLITIDNVIQSPVASTNIKSALSVDASVLTSTIFVDNEKLFAISDILQIDDELVEVRSIGIGSTNSIRVSRQFLGTKAEVHSAGSEVVKYSGNYNIVKNSIYFASTPYGKVPNEDSDDPNEVDREGLKTSSTFSGRIFLRSGVLNSTKETYSNNFIFDDISDNLTGLGTGYNLKVDENDVTGIGENNGVVLVRDIFQTPRNYGGVSNTEDCFFEDDTTKTELYFTGSVITDPDDPNISSVPLGGVISSVGSTEGSGYQPLVSAGGTAIVSAAGTIQSISIGNSGSGYRTGIQTFVNVGVRTEDLDDAELEVIGNASILDGNIVSVTITNPGSGYTSSNPPIVVFDSPVGYTNIPLIYSSTSSGIGTGAKINITIGQSGEVIDFDLTESGIAYEKGDILTVGLGGTVGIPTNSSLPFEEFQILVDSTYNDDVSVWSFGEIEVLDSFDEFITGSEKKFPIRKNGNLRTIKSGPGSPIDVQNVILVFVNNILQVPGVAYEFNGGSFITFKEALNVGDKTRMFFYRGTPSIDVLDVDILESVKPGDLVRLSSDNSTFDQDKRQVLEILSTDAIETNTYTNPGLSTDSTLLRAFEYCRTKEDKIINGKAVSKDRISYEPLIVPTANIIQPIGVGTTGEFFVDNVKTFFDSEKELTTLPQRGKIEIISQDETKVEVIDEVIYQGDFGYISGITTTTVGVSTDALILSLSIPGNSVLQDESIVNPTIETSNLYPGAFFTVRNSNVGTGLTSLYNDGSVLSIGSSYIDNVYQVYDTSLVPNTITSSQIIFGSITYDSPATIDNGVTILVENGATITVSDFISLKVTTLVSDLENIQNELLFTTFSYFGDYSWGRVSTSNRIDPKSFDSYHENSILGISTSPVLRRVNPLKFKNYAV